MKSFFAALVSILREKPARCKAECPSCGEGCILGVHGTGGHACGNGHNWGSG